MESMGDVNRVIEREIKKGSCPLRFEPKGFGDYKYNEIDSEDKLVDVLSYLLRIGNYERYATKMTNTNVYMDLKHGKQEYHRTYNIFDRKKIYSTIMKSTKKLQPDYNGKIYLETVCCFFTLPPVAREKYKMQYKGKEALGMILAKKHILGLFTNCLVQRATDAGEKFDRAELTEIENSIVKLSNVKTGLFQTLLMDDVKFVDGGVYANFCTIYLLK